MLKRFMQFGALFVLCAMFTGCATAASVKGSRGSGRSETYNYPYEQTYQAAVDAMRDQAIEILEKDRETGTIIGKKGVSAFSYGERVGIYLYKLEEAKTKVEVISAKVLATNVFAKDWTDAIFVAIRKNLEGK